jgi:hypothetical protein
MRSRIPVFSLFLILALPILGADLSVQPNRIGAQGMSPGGEVIVFGVTLEHAPYASREVRTLATVTADATGFASYAPPGGVHARSVWFMVDATTGAVSSGAPTSSPATITDIAKEPGHNPGATRFTHGFVDFMEFLLVRPRRGAWELTVGDGGPADDDGRNDNSVSVAFARTRSFNGSNAPAPPTLTPRDVLLAIDPYTLHAYLVTVQP